MILFVFFTLYFFLSLRQKFRVLSYYLPNDRAKLNYLLYLRTYFPALFLRPSKYGRDLFEILDTQVKIYKRINSLKEYKNLMEKKNHFLSLKILISAERPLSPNCKEGTVRDFVQFNILKEDLRQFMIKFQQEINFNLLEKISHEARLLTLNPERFWRAYMEMRLFNGMERMKFAKLSFREKWENMRIFLQSRHSLTRPLRLILPHFDLKKFGIKENMNAKDFLSLIMINEEIRIRLEKFIQIYVFISSEENSLAEEARVFSLPTLIDEKLKDMQLVQLEKFNQKIQFKRSIKSLKKLTGLNKNFNLFWDVRRNVKLRLKSCRKPISEMGKILRLDEVPPFVAIFRGHVGRDCSTQYSFPYPNSPMERVFFIYHESDDGQGQGQGQETGNEVDGIKKEIKGYLSGTIVEVNGQKAFYLHTIAGKRISHREIRMMIQGFHQIKREMGVLQIVLPELCQISSLMNDSNIRQELEQVIKGQEKVEITYLDKTIRGRIDDLVVAKYDCVASNVYGHFYRPWEGRESHLLTKIQPREYPHFSIEHKILPCDAIRLILDLKYMERMDTVKRVLKVSGISIEDFDDLIFEVNNPQRLKIEDYLERMKDIFGKFHIDFQKEFFLKKSFYFSKGLLRATNAMDECYRKQTIQLLIMILKKKNIDGINEITKFLVKNKELLNQDALFLKFVSSLLQNTNESGQRDSWKFLFLYNLQIFNLENIYYLLELLLHEDHLKIIREDFCQHQKIGVKGQIIFKLLENLNPLPNQYFLKIEETVKHMIERGDPITLRHLAQKMVPALKTPQAKDLMRSLMEKGHTKTF